MNRMCILVQKIFSMKLLVDRGLNVKFQSSL
jgi:hypothetical protein